MSEDSIKLPEILEFNDYGNYDSYEKALLKIYKRDLWDGGLQFNGLNVIPRVHKRFKSYGRTLDWTFAHFTSKGPVEDDRELDLRRCERIEWIKVIIENAHLDCVKVWENERFDQNGKVIRSVVLWCEYANSKIVITKRSSKGREYYVITTFYLINGRNKIKNHNDEYDAYIKKHGEYVVTPNV